MILHHVTHRARFLKVSSTATNANGFADRDLHMLNCLAAPELLEDSV